jgi:hypothetical protein
MGGAPADLHSRPGGRATVCPQARAQDNWLILLGLLASFAVSTALCSCYNSLSHLFFRQEQKYTLPVH